MAPNHLPDARKVPVTRKRLAVLNESMVFEVFPEGEKLTMLEIAELATEKSKALGQKPLSERTIRRSVDTLVKNGFVRQAGKQQNAMLYAKVGTSFANSQIKEELIPLAGNLVSVEDFLRLMVEPDSDVLWLKYKVMSKAFDLNARRRMAAAILTAGDAGYNDLLKKLSADLYDIANDLSYSLSIIRGFLDSPVWYPQYRDRMAGELRKVVEKDPELHQLAQDFVKGGSE